MIRNLAVENCSIESRTSGGLYAAGIAGKIQNSLIEDCYVSGRIVINGETAYSAGGIAGAVFQNGDGENVELVNNLSRCVSNVVVGVEHEQGESGSLAGYVEDTALVENCYSLVDGSELFGSEAGGGHSCERLSKNTWGNENRYIGFDFENVWKITDGGARLIGQAYQEDAEVIVEAAVPEEEDENKDSVDIGEREDEDENGKQDELVSGADKVPEDGVDAQASEDITSGDFTYRISGDNATITGYSGSGGSLSIPGQIDGYTVTEIGDNAFYNTDLTDIVFPESIKQIGGSAFSNCEKLTNVEFTENEGKGHTVGLGVGAFSNSGNLASVRFSPNVVSIGRECFYGDRSLENVELPERLEYIGGQAFRGTYIKSITIPRSVTECGTDGNGGPFAGATQLTEVVFENGMEKIPSCILYCSGITSYVTKAVMPESVTAVGSSAFNGCGNLEGEGGGIFPSTLEDIEESAFYGCSKLGDIAFPGNVKQIGGSAFSSCGNMENITFPGSIKQIGGSAFSNCEKLTSVEFTENEGKGHTVGLGVGAFSNNGNLASVRFSPNVVSIGRECFYGDRSLENVELPERLEYIGGQAFRGTYIKSITIPRSVTECGTNGNGGPFAGATQLTEVVFENGMEKIPSNILYCNGVTSYVTKVIIPESVTEIGDNAFYKCDNITIYGYKNSYAESYAITESIPFVSVAIAKNASANDVINQLDINHLINNISFAGNEIQGPTVTIAGKTFSLFTIPASMEIALGDKVQAKVDEDKKLIQVMIGFDDFEGSAKLDPNSNKTAYWSESYKQVKSLYTGITGKQVTSTELWNKFSKLRGRLKKMNCNLGINASASAAGYLEFSYASGEITYSSGGVVLEAAIGADMEYKLPPCPAVYVTFGVSSDFKGKLSLVREETLSYTPAMNTAIDLSANLGVGAGSKKAKTYAELGLIGTLGMNVKLPADSLSDALLVNLSAYAYFESAVFGFNGPDWGPEEFASVQLYPRSSKAALFGGQDLVDFDLDKAEPMDRSYINAPTPHILETSGNTIFSKANLYRYNTPQLARLDNGTLFLAWVDDNGEKNDANKTSLMFSVYDGSEWSEAKAIAETEGANDYPYICTDGQKVQIVWQKAAQMPAGTTLTDVLESVELYTVTWQDGKLSDASPLTSGNQTYEMMQSAAINGNSMAVAWAENSANNPFQAEGTNTIKLSRYASGRWEESTLASSLEEVANLNVAYVGNEPVVTYEASGDNGNVIHLVRENAEKTFTGSCAEMAGGILYYNDGSSLKAYDISTGLTEKVMDTALGDFTVIDDGINRVIISTEYNGLASELVSYTFDQSTGKWSDQVTLTDAGKYIRDYSAVMDKNGCLSAALNLVDTDENSAAIYGNAQLCVMDFADLEDLIIGESVYYDQAALEPGGQLPLNFAVTNNGAKPISQFHVEILDEAGTVLQSGQVSCEAGVGEAAEVSYTYTLPSVIQNQTLTLKIYTDNETKLSDNTASVELGLADIAIGSMYLSGNSTAAVLKGQITNIGWQDAQPVTVTVYDTHENGGMVGTAQLGSLPQGESKDFEIAVAQAYLDVNPLANGNTLYVSAVTDSSEMDYANNSDYYLIQSATDAPLVLNSGSVVLDENGTGQLEVVYSSLLDVKTETITWTSSDDSVVTVIDGKLTAVGEGQAVVTAVIKGYTVSATVKVDGGVPVTGIYLEENTVNMLAGSSRKLTANVLPANASNKKVLWESTDTSIAEVSADGTVTAKGIGTAAVEAHTEDGYKTASCKVTVSQAADTIYTVTFSGGEGSSGRWPAALTGTARTVVTLPENTYTKAGYVFIGWSDGENTLEAGSAYRIPYRSMELTAVWNEVPKKEYTITASSQAGGSISPDGETTVEEGESQTYTITPDQGYHIGDVKVDGESAGALSEYTFENVTANHTIEALFNKDESVKIEKITLSQTEASLKKGETLKLEAVVTPDTAADKQLKWSSDNVQTASVDNGLVTAIGKGTAVITAESQDGSHVSASCRVTVAEDQVPEGGQKYTITSSCNEGGSISPAGKTEVPEGEDKKYTITPDQGYHIQDVKADGISIGAVTEYTFEKVAGDHTIEAFFEKDEPAGNEKKEQKMSVKPGKLVFTAGGKAQTLKVSGARGILTYISSNPKVVKPSKTGKMTPLAAGKAVITIKASGDEEYKAKTIKVKAEVFPKKPAQVKKVKAAPAKAKRTAKVTWKKTSASGYQIQYAYSKKVGKGKTIKVPKGKSVSKTIKKLKSRKYVYVRVRAYNTKAGLTSYGKWSKTIRSRKKIR